jgi:hypothetical protein
MARLSVVERDELWDRYEAGESQRSIGRRLGRSASTIRTHLASAGWRRPTPVGEWCSVRLSLGEREEISRGLARDESLRSIASRLERAPSTVSREIKINGGHKRYRAVVAHRASRKRAKRPKPTKLAECRRLCEAVEASWSCGGLPARFHGGWRGHILMMRRCGCHTKRSTSRCMSRAEGRCVGNCGGLYAPDEQYVGLRAEHSPRKARSGTWS